MKSVILKATGKVLIEEREIPKLKQGDILVEMKACGLCGTDIEKMHGEYTASQPILGHEPAGVIANTDEGVGGLKVGDRVFPHHHVPCYNCYYCNHGSETMCPHYRQSNLDPGGFSEYFRVPTWNVERGGVIVIPNHVSFEEASFTEPLACCIRALKACPVSKEDAVLVVGAGPMGLTHLQLLTSRGVRVFVSDVSKVRMEFAERLGAHGVYDASNVDVASNVRKETNGRGVDLAIVASGSPKAIIQALKAVRKGGRICLFGAPVKDSKLDYDFSEVFNAQVSIISSYAAIETETQDALKLIAEGKLNLTQLITHRFKIEDFHEAVKTAKKADCVKIIITP